MYEDRLVKMCLRNEWVFSI